jgi:hypothetical protein
VKKKETAQPRSMMPTETVTVAVVPTQTAAQPDKAGFPREAAVSALVVSVLVAKLEAFPRESPASPTVNPVYAST